MSYSDEEDTSGLGDHADLGFALRVAGFDPSALSSSRSLGGPSGSGSGGGGGFAGIAAIDNDDENAKFMDDEFNVDEEGDETAAARLARQRRDDERFYRQALAMQQAAHAPAAVAERKRKAAEQEETAREMVQRLWPEWAQGGRLKMSEIFYETPQARVNVKRLLREKKQRTREKIEHHFKTAPLPETTHQAEYLEASLPELEVTRPNLPLYQRPVGAYFDAEWKKAAKMKKREEMRAKPAGLSLSDEERADAAQVDNSLDLFDWESSIVFETYGKDGKPNAPYPAVKLLQRNNFLESGDWLRDIVWDSTRIDPALLESDEEDLHVEVETKRVDKVKAKLDMFNLSNDHLYEQERHAKYRIRQTFGSIEVYHAGPAKSLQLPFYKTTLSKPEARTWRRPPLQFPTGVPFTFSKVIRGAKVNKKALVTDPSESFQTTKDLTMSVRRGADILLEFSEEYPPIMSGYGMGTTVVNYYRKKHDKDDHVPKLDFGQPSILNPSDAEPFLLGYVDKGKVTQIIHNNLLRAPVFKHTPETTDFLVVRQTVEGVVSYYLRQIKNIFTVGQTTPNQSEVPGPHARKSTHTAKQRLQIIAWLMINREKEKKIKIRSMLKYFPEQTELQIRQRLKIKGNEFLLYARHPSKGEGPGTNHGYWQLNPDFDWPKERAQVLEQCTPEMAMLYEAMQVGARHLHDAGYSKTAEGKGDDEEQGEDGMGLDIEQQLAVWSTTLNYKKAEGQKAWLVVHGEGEPTGRGEGFSFLKTNMKSYFLRKGETEEDRRDTERMAGTDQLKISNAREQGIYDEEKRKVWNLQAKALSDPNPPELDPDQKLDLSQATPSGFAPKYIGRSNTSRGFSRGHSVSATPGPHSPREGSPAYSVDGESAYTGNANANRVLRITRVKNGKTVKEIVRDPAVINQYLKRREENRLEYLMNNPDELEKLGDENITEEDRELIKEATRRKIAQLKKNQARRLARKKTMRGELESYEDETGKQKRRCGACGQAGHTRANRLCPKFQAAGPSPADLTPSAATPGGYGMAYTPQEVPEQAPTSFKIKIGTGR